MLRATLWLLASFFWLYVFDDAKSANFLSLDYERMCSLYLGLSWVSCCFALSKIVSLVVDKDD